MKPKFYKCDLVKSKRFKDKVDILNAVLKNDELYTLEQVNKLINNFLSKEVK